MIIGVGLSVHVLTDGLILDLEILSVLLLLFSSINSRLRRCNGGYDGCENLSGDYIGFSQ